MEMLLFFLPSIVAQQWNSGYHQPPLQFPVHNQFPNHYTAYHDPNGVQSLTGQQWQNAVNQGQYPYGTSQGYGTPSLPLSTHTQHPTHYTDGPVTQDGVIESGGGSDSRQTTAAPSLPHDNEYSDDSKVRWERSYPVASVLSRARWTTVSLPPSTDHLSLRLDDMEACPPPTIKYIVLRTLDNGMEVAEEAVEIPIAVNYHSQKAIHELLQSMDAKEGKGGKRNAIQGKKEKQRKVTATTTTPSPQLAQSREIIEVDEKCNNEVLKKLIVNNIVPGDAGASKRAIHDAVPSNSPSVDVVCSTTGFTYLVTTTDHCEAQTDGVICFAYRNE